MMKYLRGTFTCPVSTNTNQRRWDLAFLTRDEFTTKYGMTPEQAVKSESKK